MRRLKPVYPNPRTKSSVRVAFCDSKKIPKKFQVRDLDVFPGFVCTKDARVSVGSEAYYMHCI
jgi:hypothetical protein